MTSTATEPETERTTMVWPKALKDAVREKVGPRGLTDFAIAAVERHLVDADPIAASSEEVGELRHLCQLLADRLAMGGDDEARREALMELDLQDWLDTTGWPHEMAALVRPAPLEAPAQPAAEVQTAVQIDEEAAPAAEGERDDLFARMARKTGQDLDPGFKDLQRASDLPIPPKPSEDVHNHAWERTDGILCCQCGAWIDESDPEYPQGIVRDENWKGPSVTLTVPLNPATEVTEVVVISEPGDGKPVTELLEHFGVEGQTYVAPAAPAEKVMCPNGCGDELVAGECWTCA